MFASLLARRAGVALFALAVIGAATPVAAENPPPSPAAILIAKQIVEIKGVKQLFDPLVRGMVEKAKNMFMQTNFMLAKDLNESAAAVHKEFDPRVNELLDQTARIYAGYFTEPELKSLLAFYQSPLGQKVVVEEPKVLDQAVAFAGRWAEGLSDGVVARMRAEMKKRGHDL